MPKFEIHVVETRIHYATVEAPDYDAALTFAESVDFDLLHESAHPDCYIDDIFELKDDEPTDFLIDEDGKIVRDLREGL